jgi:hypothetical protein
MRYFIRHYIEMVIAMLVGMAVIGGPVTLAFDAAGVELSDTARLLNMGLSMTVPMVAWMRYRGHGWRLCNEMAAAMLLPTFVAIALLGAVDDFDTLMALEHVAMFVAMFGAMLLRRDEYTHSHAVTAA